MYQGRSEARSLLSIGEAIRATRSVVTAGVAIGRHDPASVVCRALAADPHRYSCSGSVWMRHWSAVVEVTGLGCVRADSSLL